MVAALRGLVLDVVAMARTGRLKKSEYEALAEFRYELRKFIHFSEAAAQNAGITPQQHQALLAIKGFPGREEITIGELAERLQLRHHSVAGLIDRLVIEGLVSRVQSETDRRQVLVHLSNQGEKMLEKLSNIHRTQLKQLGPELNTLIERLNNIRD
jgi:DNA-binding MarR family transcriptional regulator